MTTLSDLFASNRAWARRREAEAPGFFERLSEGQAPPFHWIGCADSRVPPNEIVGMPPGELFVHRNVANVVAPDDDNAMSVLQYAVASLGVEHVIVCGHYGCGGVQAVLGPRPRGHLDRWLGHVRQVRDAHAEEVEGLSDEARWRRLCELNVRSQVEHVRRSDVVREAWDSGASLHVHGWIYSLEDGLLHDLEISVSEDVATS